jgi:RNA polymerase sigma factor (TIGR02999 family)
VFGMTERSTEKTSPSDTAQSITQLLHRWADGDPPAGEQLFDRVYEELRVVAHTQRRRWYGDETLGTTALVHEVYLRLAASDALSVVDRAHFFAVAARATRQVLSNYARRQRAERRGGHAQPVPLDVVADVVPQPVDVDAIDRLWALEACLERLHTLHPRPCRVIECRYFAGMSIGDTALALGVSEATVKRDWAMAQAWLFRELSHHSIDGA